MSRLIKFFLRFKKIRSFVTPPIRYRKDEAYIGLGMSLEIRYKVLFGKAYIIDCIEFVEPPHHPNCRCVMPEVW